MRQRIMAKGSSCAPSTCGHLTNPSLKHADGCCGTTPSRPGRRCSRRAGESAHHQCVDAIPTSLQPVRDNYTAEANAQAWAECAALLRGGWRELPDYLMWAELTGER